MASISSLDGLIVIRDGKAQAECCGGGNGECCFGVWYADGSCGEGMVFLRWGTNPECCGCVPATIFDGRVGEEVPVESVQQELCYNCGPGGPALPYDESGQYIGCLRGCCDGDRNCTERLEVECLADGHTVVPCCEGGCPRPCCKTAKESRRSYRTRRGPSARRTAAASWEQERPSA